jgi:hypothetical protein
MGKIAGIRKKSKDQFNREGRPLAGAQSLWHGEEIFSAALAPEYRSRLHRLIADGVPLN